MLKILEPVNLSNQAKVKCGEIFSHSSSEFTIFCTFCNMKSFKFEDFLLHIQNVHFENNLLKTESFNTNFNQYLKVNVKNQTTADGKDDLLWEQSYDDADVISNDDYDDPSDEGPTDRVIKKAKKQNRPRRKKTTKIKNGIESNGEDKYNSEDSKPMLNDQTTHDEDKKHLPNNMQDLPEISKTRIDSKKTAEKSKKKENEIDEHSCPECEQIFPHLKYLDRHVFDFHNGYKCSLCNKRFRLRHHLRRHIQIHTAERSFTCPMDECGRSFTDEEYLKRHLEVHTMECTFICDFENCGKAFQTQRRLTIHTYTHRKPKKLVCDTCGYSCRANITLMIHQRVHTGEKPFGCKVCDKHFVSKTALTEHMISHSNTRPHICQICNASFANPRVLKRHSFIHSDERTFKCKLCDSAFKQPNSLDGHMRRMHRAPKPPSITAPLESSLF